MRYPFWPHKTDTKFNEETWYGPHEGNDINGLLGGNTDCGTKYFPITNGKAIHVSKSDRNYGNLVVFEIKGPWGIFYVRYAHCDEIFIKEGDHVKRDLPIATMGDTGNSTACHLHYDILVKKPSNWRYYTKNVESWYTDPAEFIRKYKDIEGEIMAPNNGEEKRYVEDLGDVTFSKLIEEYAMEKGRVTSARKDRDQALAENERISGEFTRFKESCKGEKAALQTRNEEEKKRYQEFIRSLADKLGVPQSEPEVLEAIETLIAKEDKTDSLERIIKKKDDEIIKLKERVSAFENDNPLTVYGRWRAFIYALTGKAG